MSYHDDRANVSELVGQEVVAVAEVERDGNDAVILTLKDGRVFVMSHKQDCCEHVWLDDKDAPLDVLVGLITQAEEVNNPPPADAAPDSDFESRTWTFYRLSSDRGGVTLRWCGTSNGFYSERVDCWWE